MALICLRRASRSTLPIAPSSGTSEARGKAAVHCVIIGFAACTTSREKWLFEYDTLKASRTQISANNINPYLVDAPDVVLSQPQHAALRRAGDRHRQQTD